MDPFQFPDKCINLRFELVDKFTKFFLSVSDPLQAIIRRGVYKCKE